MTANLILALMMIAGLGILALSLIFFGGGKKNKQASYAKDKSKAKKADEKPAPKTASHFGQHNPHKEPFISDNTVEPEDYVIVKSIPAAEDSVDSAIASLGFSAIDNLLAEPVEPLITAPIEQASGIVIAPAKFNTAPQKKTITQDIIVLHVLAPEELPFLGYELLQAVTAAGLQFGKMDIFHRFDAENPALVLFSLCSAVEPGCFDMANIGALTCPGLSLFMRISAVENPKVVLNTLLETAWQLAEDLGGYVCDEKRQPLTDEKLHKLLSSLTISLA